MFDVLHFTPAPDADDAPRHAAPHDWPAAALDLVDVGLLLVDGEAHVLQVNRSARIELARDDHPLQLIGGQLRARGGADAATLRAALREAATRGLRRLIALDRGDHALSAAVLPLRASTGAGSADALCLLLLGPRGERVPLAVHCFANAHQLTSAEGQVLQGLCRGLTPLQIARDHGVALSTVRTQLASIRAKTHCDSLRTLVRRLAQLPPMATATLSAA